MTERIISPHPLLPFLNRMIYYLTNVVPNSFFVSERYDTERTEREAAYKNALKGSSLIVSDDNISNFSLLTKVMQDVIRSEFGVVDITGLRPNVLIELGMLYGLGKPTVILVKDEQKDTIPSNINGIELIRYSTYDELATKLKNFTRNLMSFLREYYSLVNLSELVKRHVLEIHLIAKLRKLQEENFTTKVIQLRNYGDQPIAVIHSGAPNLSVGMRFEIQVPRRLGSVELQEPVGEIVVTNIQEKLSFGPYAIYDQNHEFWKQVFSTKADYYTPTENIVVPIVPSPYDRRSSLEIDDLFKIYNSISLILHGGQE